MPGVPGDAPVSTRTIKPSTPCIAQANEHGSTCFICAHDVPPQGVTGSESWEIAAMRRKKYHGYNRASVSLWV